MKSQNEIAESSDLRATSFEREAISRPFVETVLPAKQSMIRLVYNLPVEAFSWEISSRVGDRIIRRLSDNHKPYRASLPNLLAR